MKWIIVITFGLLALFTVSFLLFQQAGYLDPDAVGEWFTWLATEYGPGLVALAIVALLVIDLFLPVPASVAMTLSGYFFGLGGALWNFIGAMGAALLGFWLCRQFGYRAMRRHLTRADVGSIERFFARYGAWAVLLSRAVPMAAEVVSCLAGLSAMRGRQFAVLSALGAAPLCLLYAWAGAASRDVGSGWSFWLAVLVPALAFGLWRLLTRNH